MLTLQHTHMGGSQYGNALEHTISTVQNTIVMSVLSNDTLNALIAQNALNGNNNVYVVSIQPAQLPNLSELLSNLSIQDVKSRLISCGILSSDTDKLVVQEVDGAALPAAANDDVLTQFGIDTFGRRQRIIRAINDIIRDQCGLTNTHTIQHNKSVHSTTRKSLSNNLSTSNLNSAAVKPSAISSKAKLDQTVPISLINSKSTTAAAAVGKKLSNTSSKPLFGTSIKSNGSKPIEESKQADYDDDIADDISASSQSRKPIPSTTTTDIDDDTMDNEIDDDDRERQYTHPRVSKAAQTVAQPPSKQSATVDDDLFASGESTRAAEFMAVKPWLGAIVAPSRPPVNNPSPPDTKLRLEWIHGYRAFDSRSNLVYNTQGNIVYPTAAIVVVYDVSTGKQLHYTGHDDDIRCLAQSPANGNIIATGQNATIVSGKGTPPSICVFDSTDFKQSTKLTLTAGDRAVRSVSFSADGKYLACVCSDDSNTVKVFDWAAKTMLATAPGDKNPIYQIKWNHKDPQEFITVGQRHIVNWRFDAKKLISKRMSPVMDGGKPGASVDVARQSFYTVAFSEKGYACVGGADGSVYIFVNGKCARIYNNIHKGKVLTLDWYPGGLISGGSDGLVHVIDKRMDISYSFKSSNKIQSVQLRDNKILVGTSGCEVYSIDNYPSIQLIDTIELTFEPITSSHSDGELWGLAVAADGQHYVTVGEDNTIAIWDNINHKLIKKSTITQKPGARNKKVLRASTTSLHPTNQCGRAIAISTDGAHITVGTNDGLVHVYDSSTLNEVHTVDLNKFGQRQVTNQSDNWIQVIQYNPAGTLCAVGTHGSIIAILDCTANYDVVHTIKSHHSFITHIDWSTDSYFIQSTCGAYELLFHKIQIDDIKSSKQVTNATSMRDVHWATFTCTFGWPVQGIFSGDMDGCDISSAEVSNNKQLIVSGDDFGKVNLYRYPCLKGNKKLSYGGHSSHVVTTRFTADDKYVLSTGGHDLAIAVWAVV